MDPPASPIAASHGELIVDRSASPATYTMTGSTTWPAVEYCVDDDPGSTSQTGGTWAANRGSFDGDVIAGGIDHYPEVIDWRLRRDGATFPVPGSGCAEPPSARWQSASSLTHNAHAAVIWTLVSTHGCVDELVPSGVATPDVGPFDCAGITYEPAMLAVATDDGRLVIDRATAPPSFRMTGASLWSGARSCTLADGTIETTDGLIGGEWSAFAGVFDGAAFSGFVRGGESIDYAYQLVRLP